MPRSTRSLPHLRGDRGHDARDQPKLPTAHRTKWTLLIVTPSHLQMVYDYDTQAEAEAALTMSQERGERAFIQPPLSAAWAGKY